AARPDDGRELARRPPSSVLNDRSLVVDDLPAVGRVLPDRRTTGFPFPVLEERVGQQVDIVRQPSTMEIRRLPYVDMRHSISLLQLVEHVGSGIAAAGSSRFPEVARRHPLEIGPGNAQLRAVEDGLAAGEIRKNIGKGGVGGENGFHLSYHDASARAPASEAGHPGSGGSSRDADALGGDYEGSRRQRQGGGRFGVQRETLVTRYIPVVRLEDPALRYRDERFLLHAQDLGELFRLDGDHGPEGPDGVCDAVLIGGRTRHGCRAHMTESTRIPACTRGEGLGKGPAGVYSSGSFLRPDLTIQLRNIAV